MTEEIRVFPINVCKGCFELQAGQCHVPECVFCNQTAPIARRVLEYVKIRPCIDKKPLDMGEYEEAGWSEIVYERMKDE